MSEAQTRRRALPPQVPSQNIRVYCKSCGEVQWGFGNHRGLYGNTVRYHWIWTVSDRPSRECRIPGEPLTEQLCPGGEVDLEKDRAP